MNPEGWQQQRAESVNRAESVIAGEVRDLDIERQHLTEQLGKVNHKLIAANRRLKKARLQQTRRTLP